MSATSPFFLSPKHPILRAFGRSAMSVAQNEHLADLCAWRTLIADLLSRTAHASADIQADARELHAHASGLTGDDPLSLDLEAVWHRYRTLLKRTVARELAESWQSPAMRVSGLPQAASHQQPVVPFLNDYQRYAIPLGTIEADLHAVQAGNPERSAASFLFSSGMGAFATLLQALAAESPVCRVIGENLYFESLRLLTGGPTPTHPADETDPGAVVAAIHRHRPDQVFLDPVANSSRLPALPLAPVMAALAALPGDRTRTLVVDTTLLGPSFRPETWLKDSHWPDHLRLVAYRSLQKLDQYGLDLVTGGAVTVWGRRSLPLASFRQLCGTHPTEEALHLLPFPPHGDLIAKLGRHERNVTLLAGWLRGLKSPWLGAVHLADGRQLAGHVGPLFWVDWCDALDAEDAQRFCHHLVRTAESMHVPMAYGTSFGFNTSRVAAFTRSNGHGTALRVAPGTENLARLARVADVWLAALANFGETLAEAWRRDPASKLQRLLQQAERVIGSDTLTAEGCREVTVLLQALREQTQAFGLAPELGGLRDEVNQRVCRPLAAGLAAFSPAADPAVRTDLADLTALTDALAALDDAVAPKRRWSWG